MQEAFYKTSYTWRSLREKGIHPSPHPGGRMRSLLIILIGLLVFISKTITITNARCLIRNGMSPGACALLAKQGCPVKFIGKGCRSSTGENLRDGGCQPKNACPFCCETSCLHAASKLDKLCMWSGSSCFRCPPGSVVFDNGLPAIPGATAVLPANWAIYGLGDSFTVYGNCNANAEFITGVNLWLAETDISKEDDPIGTIPVRIVFFYRAAQYRVGEWEGLCTSKKFGSYKSTGIYRIREVTCDFTSSDGMIIYPDSCTLPAFPPGTYDLLFQQKGSSTLGWVESYPDTGCNTAPCAFTQQMASVVLTRLSICQVNPVLQNLSFQILGTSIKPVIQSCPK